MAHLVWPVSNHSVGDGTTIYQLRKGEPWYADDPVVSAFPSSFGPEPAAGVVRTSIPRRALADAVEATTDRPGERRTTKRRK